MRRLAKATAIIAAALMGLTAKSAAPGQPDEECPLSNPKPGVSINKSGAYQGYSLIAPMNATSTYLIDMEGRIVKQWESDYGPALSAYLLDNGHLLRPAGERGFISGANLVGGRIQEFDWDGELVWDFSFGQSKFRSHHDLCRLPNGNLLVIASDPKSPSEAIAAGRRPGSFSGRLLSECILEIKPTGKTSGEIVWEWRAWDHLVQDFDKSKPNFAEVFEHPELIDLNFSTGLMDHMMRDPKQVARLRSLGYVGGGATATGLASGPPGGAGKGGARPGGARQGIGSTESDWLHLNSVAYNAKLDQIMLGLHEFSEVWVIDHSTTKAEAASHSGGRSGKGGDLLYRWGNPRAYRNGSNVDQRLFAQHGALWIDAGLPGAGHMLVFNNGNGRPDGNYSSVDEVVLPCNDRGLYDQQEFMTFGPQRAAWSYVAPDKTCFYSMLLSSAQRLPNGNTFICSGVQRVLFEVTPEGEIVWLFKYPRGDTDGPQPAQFGGLGAPPPGFLPSAPHAARSNPLNASSTQSGIFQSLRYDARFSGLAGRKLIPGKMLEEVAAANLRPAPEPAEKSE